MDACLVTAEKSLQEVANNNYCGNRQQEGLEIRTVNI